MDWRTRAACIGRWDAFDRTWEQNGPASRKEALAICRGCPVRQECLAAYGHEAHGVWGGLTASQRSRVRHGLRIIAA